MTDGPLFVSLPPEPEEQPLPPAPEPPPHSFEELSFPGVPAARQPGADDVLAVAGVPSPPSPPVEAEPPFSLPPEPPVPQAPAAPGPPSDGKPPDRFDDKRMSLIEHLEELRKVLIVSLSAWGIASLVGLALSHWIVRLLTRPLDILHLHPVVLSPMGVFSIHLKVGLVAGLVLALPVILQQVWTFVAPGLKPKERRFAGPLLLSSLTLFALGAILAFGFMFIGVRLVQLTAGWTGIQYLPELNQYLRTMVVLMLAFGITFEFPVALVLLALVGLMSSARLRRSRRVAYLVIAGAGYAVTPGVDPVTPLALIVPLLLLYEASILVIRRMGK